MVAERAQKLLSAFNAFLVSNIYASALWCVTYLQWPVGASANVGPPGCDAATTVVGGLTVMRTARTSTSVVY